MRSNEEDILKGNTLKVHRFIIEQKEPARVRGIQRSLDFSSPSLAYYHIEKLKDAGLVREEELGYVADKIVLKNLVRLKNTLIPRYYFYSLFFTIGVILELTIFRPPIMTREYLIAIIFTCAAALSFGIEAYLHQRGV